MFGYIRVFESELKIREYRLYKGVYCGLCKTMKRYLGFSSSFSLSYDFAFLALVCSEIYGEEFKAIKGRCISHPFKRRLISKENNSLKYCAGASAVLGYHKLLDDKNDSRGIKRIFSLFLLPFYRRYLRRAFKKLPEFKFEELSKKVSALLDELSLLEKENSPSCERNADIFGKVLGEVFSHTTGNTVLKNDVYNIGYHLGRFIYIIDVIDDYNNDKRRKHYNPLISSGYNEVPIDLLTATLANENKLLKEFFRRVSVSHTDVRSIINNILELGLPNMLNKVTLKNSIGRQEVKQEGAD